VVYWTIGSIFLSIDSLEKSNFLRRYKIHRSQSFDEDKVAKVWNFLLILKLNFESFELLFLVHRAGYIQSGICQLSSIFCCIID
jgi:hypothetical protein